jgi:ABC-2 type transport system ATP-binding protein
MDILAIETHGLTKTFGKHTAVDGLSLAVPRGTVFGLIGPNGAGKTTTLRMLAGLVEPSGGTIRLGGRAADGMRHTSKVHRMVGYMPDFFGVYEDMRSWEYLDFFARCYGIPAERRAQLVDELLDLVDLTGKRDADVNTLSRGMKQRLCLAHALAHDPQILLLDEPASGLDPRARLEMRELLIELRSLGKTIVVSSHILPELEDMCDLIGIMERGRLLASGDVGDIERMSGAGRDVRIRVLSPVAEAVAVLASLPGVTVEDGGEDWEDGGEGEDPEGAGNAGDAVDGVSRGDVGGPGDLGNGGWITFRLDGDEDAHAELIQRLVAAGIRFSAYQPRERDLEDLFMRITQGEVA